MIGDRIEETTQTTGTGTLTLDGAATGRRTFVGAIGLGKQAYYTIEIGAAWEVGIGTTGNSGADTLTRDTVIASSNAGSKINLSAGAKVLGAPSAEVFGAIGSRLCYGVTTGSTNAYTVAPPVTPRALVDGMRIAVKMHAAPTGAATLNGGVGGAKPIRLADAVTATGNAAWPIDALVLFQYHQANDVWCILSYLPSLLPAATAAASGIVELATVGEALTGSDSLRAVTPEDLGAALKKGSDIASAATLVIPATGGSFFHVTGTTGVTAFSDSSLVTGFEVTLYFEGAVTLTHHASNLILPGAANFTTAAGDIFRFRKIGTGQYRCVSFQTGAGVRAGVIIDRQHSAFATHDTTTSAIPLDNSLPQSGEGKAILTHSHTPKKAGNKILVRVFAPVGTIEPQYAVILALFKGSDADALRAGVYQPQSSANLHAYGSIALEYEHTAADTSQIDFKLRYGTTSGGTASLNGSSSGRLLGGAQALTITTEERAV